jgi:hypothetical protein
LQLQPWCCSLSIAARRGEIMPEEFWLRVHDDGLEGRYDHDPAPIRALRVIIIDGFEETWTAGRVSRTGWGGPNPPQRLGGDGWHRRQTAFAMPESHVRS